MDLVAALTQKSKAKLAQLRGMAECSTRVERCRLITSPNTW